MVVLSTIFLYPVPALFVGSAAVWLLNAALRSSGSDASAERRGEEQERAMFGVLAGSSATVAGDAGRRQMAEPVRFPQMPDLARLHAALSSEATSATAEAHSNRSAPQTLEGVSRP
jgi:hypothetical protein